MQMLHSGILIQTRNELKCPKANKNKILYSEKMGKKVKCKQVLMWDTFGSIWPAGGHNCKEKPYLLP